MVFLKLGFRSLFRQKRRTTITLMVITCGIGCLLLAHGHSRFINWGLKESTIHTETGHLLIFNQGYFQKEEETILEFGLDNSGSLCDELMKIDGVRLVQTRIDIMGLISNGDKSVACLGLAVQPALEKQLRGLFNMNSSIYDSMIACQEEGDIIALGQGLAQSLAARNGDYVTLMATTTTGALNAIDLKVVGTFTGISPDYDKRAILIPMSTAQLLLDTQKVKNLLVTLDDTGMTNQVYQKIEQLAKIKGYPIIIKKWYEQALYYKRVQTFYNQMTGFLSVILFIIVLFSIANTIVMAIIERTTEIGTLLSMGTSHLQIVQMFFFEGFFIGALGGIFSSIFALVISVAINHFNIILSPPPGLTDGYPLSIRNEIVVYIEIFVTTVCLATSSSILTALKVTRMKIVDALGHI